MGPNGTPSMKFGIDCPAQLLENDWQGIVSYEYSDMSKICGCVGYLDEINTNSKFTCAVVHK